MVIIGPPGVDSTNMGETAGCCFARSTAVNSPARGKGHARPGTETSATRARPSSVYVLAAARGQTQLEDVNDNAATTVRAVAGEPEPDLRVLPGADGTAFRQSGSPAAPARPGRRGAGGSRRCLHRDPVSPAQPVRG